MGLLVGTATVGSVSLMIGQSEVRRPGRGQFVQGLTIYEVSHSPDGRVAYLWGIEPETRTLTLLGQRNMP